MTMIPAVDAVGGGRFSPELLRPAAAAKQSTPAQPPSDLAQSPSVQQTQDAPPVATISAAAATQATGDGDEAAEPKPPEKSLLDDIAAVGSALATGARAVRDTCLSMLGEYLGSKSADVVNGASIAIDRFGDALHIAPRLVDGPARLFDAAMKLGETLRPMAVETVGNILDAWTPKRFSDAAREAYHDRIAGASSGPPANEPDLADPACIVPEAAIELDDAPAGPEPPPAPGAERLLSRSELEAFARDALGPTVDEADLQRHLSLQDGTLGQQKRFAKWLYKHALELDPGEHPWYAELRPELLGSGLRNAAYKLPGHPHMVVLAEFFQAAHLAQYNAQFGARAPNFEPSTLRGTLQAKANYERELLDVMTRYFGSDAIAPDLFRQTLETLPVPGRVLLAAIANDVGPHRLQPAPGKPGVWLYDQVEIDSRKTYPFLLPVQTHLNRENFFRELQGADAMSPKVCGTWKDEWLARMGDSNESGITLSSEEYARAGELWLANADPERPFDRELFAKLHGRNQKTNLNDFLTWATQNPERRRATGEFFAAMASFSNDQKMMLDIGGLGNVAIHKDADDGSWRLTIRDPIPATPTPGLANLGKTLGDIAAGRPLPEDLDVRYLGRHVSYVLAVNGMLHALGRPERIATPGLPDNPWNELYALEHINKWEVPQDALPPLRSTTWRPFPR